MKMKRMIRSVWAILLSIVMLIPIMPVFAEDASALSAEELNSEAMLEYRIVITGPNQIVVPALDGTAIIQGYTAKGQYKFFGNWYDSMLPVHLDADAFSIDGVSWNNGQDELSVGIAADTGSVMLRAWIQPLFQPKVWGELSVDIVRAESIPTRIELSGEDEIDVPYDAFPADNMPIPFIYTATVYDQYGDEMDAPVVISSVGHDALGIEFEDGTASVHNTSIAGEFEVSAQLDLVLDEINGDDPLKPHMTVTVYREQSHPVRLAINGASEINVPQDDNDVTEIYTASVLDQYGVEMDGFDVTILANNPAGTTFVSQTGTLTVTSDADHTYFEMFAFLGTFMPRDLQLAFEQMNVSKMIYLIKTPVATIDDANNLILVDPDFDEGLEYRIVAAFPDEPEIVVDTAGRRFKGWLDYNPEEPPTFPGKVDVELRYKAFEPILQGALGLQIENGFPEDYEAGPAITLHFTVLAPSIAINPVSPVTSTTVTITYNELQPGLELLPVDIYAGEWISPYGVHYDLTKEMFYKNGLAGEWLLYSAPFAVTQNTTIYAKTVVTIEPTELKEECYDPVVLTGIYTSAITELPIVFRVIPPPPPPPEEEEEPVVVTPAPPVEPVVIAPVEVPLAPLAEEPVNPLADFAFFDVLPVEEFVAPAEAVVEEVAEEVVIPTEVVPLGDLLPKTNELPLQLFYGLGAIISGLGVYLKRKG